ncbi:cobalamin biosynthesis protein CobT [Trinickia symbiotica]|uniref:Cobalamin biosynthesis protein CobT n=2 Tax=Trinickia symbiotica TaxID=863227 RepID=A0A2T3XQK6_9BURK|nr:cobalamin biosynthesis protein CobT [Trinickia symbiotica]
MDHGLTESVDDTLAHLSRLARTLTGQDRLTVVIADDGPCLRDEQLVLPPAVAGMDVSQELMTGYVDLLAARARFATQDAVERVGSPVARRLAQAIDDRRACCELAHAYPGVAPFLTRLRAETARVAAAQWTTLSWAEKLAWHVERYVWNEQSTAIESSPSLNAAVHASIDLLEEASRSASTADSMRIALRLIERIRELSAGDVNNMMFTADAQDTLDSPATRNEFESDGSDTGDAPPSSQTSALTTGGGLTRSASDAAQQPSGDAGKQPHRPAMSRAALSVPITTQFDREADFTGKGDAIRWRKLRSTARAQTESLKARLERALKADEQTHWRREQERGELDRPSLVRLAVAPGYRTPFRTRLVKPGRDAAVTLLIDRSGSMAGQKIELATLCAAALSDALSQLSFPLEVLGYSSIEDVEMREYYERWLAAGHASSGFNRFVERLDLQIYKRFDSDNLVGLTCVECGHENPDGEALSWAASRLLARRAHRHILMVLSDGYPATGDGNPDVLRADLQARITELRERGVELVGVGILTDAVETFYPTSAVVERLQDLPKAAFDVLGRTLLKHREWMLERSDA